MAKNKIMGTTKLFIVWMLLIPTNIFSQTSGDTIVYHHGMGGSQYDYRIPSLVTTQKGTLLAFAERRVSLGDHAQNDIVLRRSLDEGRTWGAVRIIADFGESSLNDPVAVVLNNGRVLLIFQEYPYGIHSRSNGWIQIADEGYDGPRNTHSWLVYSDDDGATWSRPRDITHLIRPHDMIAVGSPGVGIQLKHGKYKGRVVIPLYFTEKVNDNIGGWTNGVAWSDDNGVSWKISNDIHREGMTGYGNEAQVAELSDGSILLVARNQGGDHRQVSVSRDGGRTWSNMKVDTGLPGIACQGSLLRYEGQDGGKGLILQASPANTKARDHGVVRMSDDDGKTWKYARTIVPGFFAYSCMTVLPGGEIGLLYETDKYQTIRFRKFTKDWVKAGDNE